MLYVLVDKNSTYIMHTSSSIIHDNNESVMSSRKGEYTIPLKGPNNGETIGYKRTHARKVRKTYTRGLSVAI